MCIEVPSGREYRLEQYRIVLSFERCRTYCQYFHEVGSQTEVKGICSSANSSQGLRFWFHVHGHFSTVSHSSKERFHISRSINSRFSMKFPYEPNDSLNFPLFRVRLSAYQCLQMRFLQECRKSVGMYDITIVFTDQGASLVV